MARDALPSLPPASARAPSFRAARWHSGRAEAERLVQTIEVDGRRLAYRRAGAGPPLVLLHGGYGDGRDWQLQLETLSDQFDVVAWDAPGCGGSEDPPTDITMDGYADALVGLVEALGLGRPHIAGVSWGGGLAIAVYARRPDLVRSLVLVGAYAGWKGSLPAEEVAARLERIRVELLHPPQTWVDGYLPTFFTGEVPSAVLDLVRRMMLDVRPTGVLPMLTAFADCDLNDVLPTIAVPVLLLYGGADVRAPRPVSDALHRAVPGSQLVRLPGVGHVVQMEAPAAFDAELRRFVAAVG